LQDSRYSEEALKREREALAKSLERLADVQKELASSQKELMSGQKALAGQQDKLVRFLESPFDEASAALQVPPCFDHQNTTINSSKIPCPH
jgi:peptidoglycan hydrolase CwlO-like protein